jgi:hypothetical protein
MPRVSTRTRGQLIKVIEEWIKSGKCSGKRMSYRVSLNDEETNETEEVLVNGTVFGEVLGIHIEGKKSDDGEVTVRVTHLPTGWGICKPLPRSKALKTIFGLLRLTDWSHPDPRIYESDRAMSCRKEVWLMIRYCRGDSLGISLLERLVGHIETLLPKKASTVPTDRKAGSYIKSQASAVEVGDEADSVEI